MWQTAEDCRQYYQIVITHLEGRPGTDRNRKLEAERKAAGFGNYDLDDYDDGTRLSARSAWIKKENERLRLGARHRRRRFAAAGGCRLVAGDCDLRAVASKILMALRKPSCLVWSNLFHRKRGKERADSQGESSCRGEGAGDTQGAGRDGGGAYLAELSRRNPIFPPNQPSGRALSTC